MPIVITSVADVFELTDLVELTEKVSEEESKEGKEESDKEEESNISEFVFLSAHDVSNLDKKDILGFRDFLKLDDFKNGVTTPPPEQV